MSHLRSRAIEGYPKISDFPGMPDAYRLAINEFMAGITDSLFAWHAQSQSSANKGNFTSQTNDFFEPGTAAFDSVFSLITSSNANSEGGTRFYDRSALFHGQGEYIFKNLYSNSWINDLSLTSGFQWQDFYTGFQRIYFIRYWWCQYQYP